MKAAELVAYLRTDTDITAIVQNKIHNARVPTLTSGGGSDLPFVWLRRRNIARWPLLCQIPRMNYTLATWFDVECCAEGADEADELVDAVRLALDGYAGAMGTAITPRVAVQDQGDDYVSRNLADDAGVFINSILVEITEGG